jgi:hypothetical protein
MLGLLLALALGAGSGPLPAAVESPSGPVRIPTEIPVRRDGEVRPPGPGSAPLLLTLVLLVLTGGGVWALQRSRGRGGRPKPPWAPWFGRSEDAGGLRVVQSRQLTPRTSVHVLRWGGKEWLVGCGDQQVTVVAHQQVPVEDPPAPAQTAPGEERSTP